MSSLVLYLMVMLRNAEADSNLAALGLNSSLGSESEIKLRVINLCALCNTFKVFPFLMKMKVYLIITLIFSVWSRAPSYVARRVFFFYIRFSPPNIKENIKIGLATRDYSVASS